MTASTYGPLRTGRTRAVRLSPGGTAILVSILITILPSTLGCSAPKVPETLVMDIIIASVSYDRQWTVANLYPGNYDSSSYSSGSLTPADTQLLRSMLRDHFTYQCAYNGDKATIVADISNSGILEWLNVHKLQLKASYDLQDRSRMRIYLRFKGGRWWLVDCIPDSGGTQTPGYEDWPQLP